MSALSKITAQGQTSVPLEIRKKLGVGPGAVLEWEDDGEVITVRRAGRYTSEEVHRALFPQGAPKRRTLKQIKSGIEQSIKKRHARP